MDSCYSRGSINAPIMLIGECPGREEVGHLIKGVDRSGAPYNIPMPIPFCGGAGRVLHRMLKWADIREGEFILTNARKEAFFKGRSVRTPTEEELIEGRDALILEIKKIDPKLIITLGIGPIWTLCYHEKASKDDLRMGKMCGQHHMLEVDWFDGTKRSYKILPIFHPSAIQRDEKGERGYKEIVTKVMLQNKELINDAIGRFRL